MIWIKRVTVLAALGAAAMAQGSDEEAAVAAVQKVFDGMAAHDAAAIRSVMLPEARMYSVRNNGNPNGLAAEDFVTRIAASKAALIERFTARPQVLLQGRIAQVWGEYEFLQDGKFSHCGIDTATLFKTESGWKIAMLGWTAETTGCKGH